ncbi:hypothetical protein DFH07DRAFT_763435, partial [Mycena maculata]
MQRSGAVLLHMDSAASATWIKANMPAFLAAMGGTSAFKDRFANVVVQYVPVSFDPSLDGALQILESDNGMQKGNLGSTRWIKDPSRRRTGQRVAHAIFGFCSEPSAN